MLAIMSAGGVDMDPSGIDAVIQLWYGGQETGHGLTDIIFGRVSPSGAKTSLLRHLILTKTNVCQDRVERNVRKH